MVIKRLRPTALLVVVRRHARRHACRVVEMPGRGKGSHRLHAVVGVAGEVGRFAVPEHPRELSWMVLRSVETALAPAFGERWLEER